MRLIDADALLTDRRKRMYYHLPNGDTAIPIIDIEHAPTIEERKTGEWIDAVINHDSGELPIQVCNQCNTFFPLAYTGGGHNFCPNCGADMRGDKQ